MQALCAWLWAVHTAGRALGEAPGCNCAVSIPISVISAASLVSTCSLQYLDCESGQDEGPFLVPSSLAPLSHPCGQAKGWGGPGCWGPAAACPCFPSCYTRRACLSKCLRGRSAHPQLPEDGHQGYSKTTHGSGCRPSLLVGCHLPQPWGVPPKLGASSPLPMSCLCRRRALPDGRSPQADPEPAGGDGECPSPGMLGSLPGHGLCWCCS